MVSWAGLSEAEPAFAAAVRERFSVRKHCTLATLRRDGSPRISGIEVAFDGGELVLGMMPGSMKARDVLHDPRVALHSPTVDPVEEDPSEWPGEAKIAGRVVEMDTEGEGHSFRLDIAEASFVRVAPSREHLLVEVWREGVGLRRIERKG